MTSTNLKALSQTDPSTAASRETPYSTCTMGEKPPETSVFFASWEAMPMSQSPKHRRSQNRGHKNKQISMISSTYHQISNMKVGFGGFSSMGRDCFQMVRPVQWWQVQRAQPSGYASCIAKWPCASAPYIQRYFKKTGKDPCFAITYDSPPARWGLLDFIRVVLFLLD